MNLEIEKVDDLLEDGSIVKAVEEAIGNLRV